jgi:hypothetical protein
MVSKTFFLKTGGYTTTPYIGLVTSPLHWPPPIFDEWVLSGKLLLKLHPSEKTKLEP